MKEKIGLSSTALSLLATLFMTMDHVAAVFLDATQLWYPMRALGRISFPLFAFLLAQSAVKTSSPKRFLLRLAVFAFIAEIPFDLAFYNSIWYIEHQSVMLTLFLGAAALVANKRMKLSAIPSFAAIVAACLAAQLCCTDYGGYGVALIVMLGFSSSLLSKAASILLFVLVMSTSVAGSSVDKIYYFMLLAVPLIALYNGKRGGEKWFPPLRRWFFYLYYPAHLSVIWLVLRKFPVIF